VKPLLLTKGGALVIVAHPDDETIWMGGTILANPNIKWTIFSLCRESDVDRSPKFKKVCAYYKARSLMSDIEDEGIMNVEKSIPFFSRELSKKLKNKHFSYLFTHAENGEYGHMRHKGVHYAIKKLLKKKLFAAECAMTFAYRGGKSGKYAIPRKNADFISALPQTIFNKKRRIVESLYGFSKNSFEYKSCNKKEMFNILTV